MQRDLLILLVVLAILAGIGVHVLTDGEDIVVRTGQPAVAFGPTEAPPAPAAPVLIQASSGGQCVEMRFLDEKGVVIPVDPPLVGIMVGDSPLFEGRPPPFAKSEAGRFLSCPPELLASVRKSFIDLCSSEERRNKSAADNAVDIALVNKRCGDLSAALPN